MRLKYVAIFIAISILFCILTQQEKRLATYTAFAYLRLGLRMHHAHFFRFSFFILVRREKKRQCTIEPQDATRFSSNKNSFCDFYLNSNKFDLSHCAVLKLIRYFLSLSLSRAHRHTSSHTNFVMHSIFYFGISSIFNDLQSIYFSRWKNLCDPSLKHLSPYISL